MPKPTNTETTGSGPVRLVKPRGRNGGRKATTGTPYTRKVQTRISGQDGASFDHWATLAGQTEAEYLRSIVEEHLRAKQFL